jgi:hypothetical protein
MYWLSWPWSIWASMATVAGIPVGLVGLIYTAVQLQHGVRVSRGQFMLELERMISVHDAVHLRLRPSGDWTAEDKGLDCPLN